MTLVALVQQIASFPWIWIFFTLPNTLLIFFKFIHLDYILAERAILKRVSDIIRNIYGRQKISYPTYTHSWIKSIFFSYFFVSYISAYTLYKKADRRTMIFFLNILITITIIILYHKLVQLLRLNLERTQCKSKGISSGYNQSGKKCQSIRTHT